MKLYYKSHACSLSPHIILAESELDYEIESVDLAKKITETGEDFYKINPKGQVPCLVLDDGTILTEGVAIVQYLADLVPQQGLIAPVKDINRYHQIEWLNYISSELHKGFVPFFGPNDDAIKAKALEKLKTKFDFVEAHLSKNDYLVNNAFSVADAYLFTVLGWRGAVPNFPKYPACDRFFERVSKRPSVQIALKEENMI